jgi:cell division protein FtsB
VAVEKKVALEKKKRFRWRWKWKRLITLFALAYLGFWSIQSGLHIWVLSHDEASLTHNIQVVQSQDTRLNQDIRELRNPAMVKKMITGQIPVPNANVP